MKKKELWVNYVCKEMKGRGDFMANEAAAVLSSRYRYTPNALELSNMMKKDPRFVRKNTRRGFMFTVVE